MAAGSLLLEITMHRRYLIANALLWAAAIIASATAGAPGFLCVALLPALAAVSLLLVGAKRSATECVP
jgi:hypothetical protein